MAEAAGLALGAIGLAALFSTCIDAFDRVRVARTQDSALRILSTKLENQKVRFILWGQSLGLDSEAGYDSSLDHPIRRDPVRRTMALVYDLFMEGDTLQRRYGLQRESDGLRAASVSNANAVDQSAWKDLFKKIRAKVKKQQLQTTPVPTELTESDGSIVRWVIVDREEFTSLVTNLRELIDDLDSMCKFANVREYRRRVVQYEIESIGDTESLQLIRAASADDDDDAMSIAASHRLGELEGPAEVRSETSDYHESGLLAVPATQPERLRFYTPPTSVYQLQRSPSPVSTAMRYRYVRRPIEDATLPGTTCTLPPVPRGTLAHSFPILFPPVSFLSSGIVRSNSSSEASDGARASSPQNPQGHSPPSGESAVQACMEQVPKIDASSTASGYLLEKLQDYGLSSGSGVDPRGSERPEVTRLSDRSPQHDPPRHKHDRPRACATCRRRRFRCDGSKPECRSCAEAGVVCGGYDYLLPPMRKSSRAKVISELRQCSLHPPQQENEIIPAAAESASGDAGDLMMSADAGLEFDKTVSAEVRSFAAYDPSVDYTAGPTSSDPPPGEEKLNEYWKDQVLQDLVEQDKSYVFPELFKPLRRTSARPPSGNTPRVAKARRRMRPIEEESESAASDHAAEDNMEEEDAPMETEEDYKPFKTASTADETKSAD